MRLTYYLRPLEKLRYRARCFFYIETLPRDCDNNRGRGHDLCLRVFEKVLSFTPFDRRPGNRSVSGIRPTCQCRCPPLNETTILRLLLHAIDGHLYQRILSAEIRKTTNELRKGGYKSRGEVRGGVEPNRTTARKAWASSSLYTLWCNYFLT